MRWVGAWGVLVPALVAVGRGGVARADENPVEAADARPARPEVPDMVPVRDPAWRLAVAPGPGDVAPPPAPPQPRTERGVEVTADRPAPTVEPAPAYRPHSPSGLAQDTRIGPNGQPEWTTERRFTTSRVYVLPPWQVEFESWWRGKWPKDSDVENRFQEEIGVGLPYRFQLDLYANVEAPPHEDAYYSGTQVEVRWALADWNCLPANPALYAEWKFQTHGQPDAWEVKALFGGDLSPRWQYGANLFYERETGGDEAEEMGVTGALSYLVCDTRLSVGVEAQYERASDRFTRDDPTNEVLLGPSIQVRFDHRTHLDIAPLFGLTHDSPDLEMYVVLGIDIGPGGGEGGWLSPVSARSR